MFVDGGVRSGLDVLKFLGLGARACFLGRAYLYGLGAYGRAGVTKALQILSDELSTAMALTGVTDVQHVPSDVILRPPPDEISFTPEEREERSAFPAFTKDKSKERP